MHLVWSEYVIIADVKKTSPLSKQNCYVKVIGLRGKYGTNTIFQSTFTQLLKVFDLIQSRLATSHLNKMNTVVKVIQKMYFYSGDYFIDSCFL